MGSCFGKQLEGAEAWVTARAVEKPVGKGPAKKTKSKGEAQMLLKSNSQKGMTMELMAVMALKGCLGPDDWTLKELMQRQAEGDGKKQHNKLDNAHEDTHGPQLYEEHHAQEHMQTQSRGMHDSQQHGFLRSIQSRRKGRRQKRNKSAVQMQVRTTDQHQHPQDQDHMSEEEWQWQQQQQHQHELQYGHQYGQQQYGQQYAQEQYRQQQYMQQQDGQQYTQEQDGQQYTQQQHGQQYVPEQYGQHHVMHEQYNGDGMPGEMDPNVAAMQLPDAVSGFVAHMPTAPSSPMSVDQQIPEEEVVAVVCTPMDMELSYKPRKKGRRSKKLAARRFRPYRLETIDETIGEEEEEDSLSETELPTMMSETWVSMGVYNNRLHQH